MTVAAYILLAGSPVLFGLADPEESVASGREAFDRWVWDYPWYDAEADALRPVEVSKPWYLWWEWFFDWLDGLFTFGRGGAWSWRNWLAWSGIAVLVALLVWLMVRAWRKRARREAASSRNSGRADPAEEKRRVEALPSHAGRKRDDLLAAAAECYQQGNYAEAIIYLFSHQLVELDKSQLIRLAKGKTNRQYLRELGRRITLRRLLQRTMVAFEEVFFGNYSIDRARFESVWAQQEEFDALVMEGAA